MMIRGVLFDIGDTLLDATGLQRRTVEETAEEVAGEWNLDPKEFARAYDVADRDPRFDEMLDLNHLYSDRRVVARAFELLSRQPTSLIIEHFLRLYRARLRAKIRPDEGLTDALERLKDRGLKLGVVSNGTTEEQLDQLERLRVKDYFDPILISQELGISKPNPGIFLLACDEWQMPPGEILVAGDSCERDIAGARHAGMRSALVTQFVDRRDAASQDDKPDLVVGDLSLLPDVINQLNRASDGAAI